MSVDYEISLKLIADVYHFVNVVTEHLYEYDVDVHSKNNSHHVVDAKSLLGLLSLNLADTVIVELRDCKDLDDIQKFKNIMHQFKEDK